MFWIFFGIVLLIVSLSGLLLNVGNRGTIRDGWGVFSGLSCAFLIAVFLFIVQLGQGVYPYLGGKYEEIIALKSEIETIRSAHYGNVVSGVLVGGSLDNIKQSEILSRYIKQYAYEKAIYNRRLKSAQLRRRLRYYRIFGDGAFLHHEIDDLKFL